MSDEDLSEETGQVVQELARIMGQGTSPDLPIGLSPRFQSALFYACEIHARQKRKGTEIPYISHLLGVASLIMEAGGSEDEVIAGLLHDAVEDQGGVPRLLDIKDRFGDNVAKIVHECTDGLEDDSGVKPPWEERKKAYIEHLKTASPSARLVSNADKLHNVRSIRADFGQIGHKVYERFSQSSEKTLWYYSELLKEFMRDPPSEMLVSELDHALSMLRIAQDWNPELRKQEQT